MKLQKRLHQNNDSMLISYKLLRKLIGWLGIGLPFVMVIGAAIVNCRDIEPSISDYYHTGMRNILVGILCAVALFMFAYKGPEKIDSYLGNAACIFALGIAFFPTYVVSSSCTTDCSNNCSAYANWISDMHFISAFLFFVVLIVFSLFLFTRSNQPKSLQSVQKRKRNTVYHWCGYIMIVCVVLLALYFFIFKEKYPQLIEYNTVFWLESVALWAFGTSWLVKGQLVMKD